MNSTNETIPPEVQPRNTVKPSQYGKTFQQTDTSNPPAESDEKPDEEEEETKSDDYLQDEKTSEGQLGTFSPNHNRG